MATLKKLVKTEKPTGKKTEKPAKPTKGQKTAAKPTKAPAKKAVVKDLPETVKLGKRNVKIAQLKASAQKDAAYFARGHQPSDNPGRWKYLVRSAVRSGLITESDAAGLCK